MTTSKKQQAQLPDEFEITIKRSYSEPCRTREYHYETSKSDYVYAEWIDNFDRKESVVLNMRTSKLDLNRVVAALLEDK